MINLKDMYLYIYEKLSLPIIIVSKRDGEFDILKKHEKTIEEIDRLLSNIYEYPIKFFESIKDDFINGYPDGKYYFYYDYVNEDILLFNLISDKTSYKVFNVFKKPALLFEGIYEKNLGSIDSLKSIINKDVNGVNIFFEINGLKFKSFNFRNDIRQTKDINAIIIKSIIDFTKSLDLSLIIAKSKTYIDLIYNVYSKYVVNFSGKDIERNSNLEHPIFDINLKLLSGKTIKYPELFKLFLNVFYRFKNYKSSLIIEDDLKSLKMIIYNMSKKLDANANDFITFDNFFK